MMMRFMKYFRMLKFMTKWKEVNQRKEDEERKLMKVNFL